MAEGRFMSADELRRIARIATIRGRTLSVRDGIVAKYPDPTEAAPYLAHVDMRITAYNEALIEIGVPAEDANWVRTMCACPNGGYVAHDHARANGEN